MEFRIFFPLVHEDDYAWLPKEVADSYMQSLENIAIKSTVTPEVRTDSYFVGKPHFGLKFRHGKKLEIKVRGKDIVHGIEKWNKYKLGKKELSHYTEDIGKIFTANGHDVDSSITSLNDQIALEKSRHNIYTDSLTFEACHLVVDIEQPNFSNPLPKRKWFSIAIEGELNDISNFLSSTDDSLHLKAAFTTVNHVLQSHINDVIPMKFLPIVSGYPMFVHHLSGNITSDEIQHDVIGTWNELMQKIEN